jgi:hypothetical protein
MIKIMNDLPKNVLGISAEGNKQYFKIREGDF